MALVECPACRKRISSLAKQCSHCNAALTGDSDSKRKIQQINKATQLQTHSFLSLTLFIAGVVIWFWGGESAEGARLYVGGCCFAFGFIGYLITRVRLVLYKRRSV